MNREEFFKLNETALLKSTFGRTGIPVRIEKIRRHRTLESALTKISYVISLVTYDLDTEQNVVTKTEVEQSSLAKMHAPATKSFLQIMADPGGSH